MTPLAYLKYGIPALLVALLGFYIVHLRDSVTDVTQQRDKAVVSLQVASKEASGGDVSIKTITKYVHDTTVITEKGKTIDHLVQVYVPASGACAVLDPQWVSIHNAATTASVPVSTTASAGTANSP